MKYYLLPLIVLICFNSQAQKKTKVDPATAQVNANKAAVVKSLDNNYAADSKTAMQIWNYAEVGYKETKSAALHVQNLRAAGFKVETGVADIPTAFVATYGSGSPVIAILAEYDALPGLAQTATPEKNTIEGQKNTSYLSDKIGLEGDRTRSLINELQTQDLNRRLIERNTEIERRGVSADE